MALKNEKSEQFPHEKSEQLPDEQKSIIGKVKELYTRLDSISPSDIVNLIQNVGTTLGTTFVIVSLVSELIKKWLDNQRIKIRIKSGETEFEYEGNMKQSEVRRITRELLASAKAGNSIKLLPAKPREDKDSGKKH